jgi:hypothetical protein
MKTAKHSRRSINRIKKKLTRKTRRKTRKIRKIKTRRVHRRKTRKMRGGGPAAALAAMGAYASGKAVGSAIGDQLTKIKCNCPLDNCSAREPTGMGGYQAMVHGVLPTHAPGKCDAIWDRGVGSRLREMGVGALAVMMKPSASQADIDQHDWLIGYGAQTDEEEEKGLAASRTVNFCNRCYRHMIQEARKDETKDTLRDKIAGLLNQSQANLFVSHLASTEFPANEALFDGPSPKQAKNLVEMWKSSIHDKKYIKEAQETDLKEASAATHIQARQRGRRSRQARTQKQQPAVTAASAPDWVGMQRAMAPEKME